MALFDFNVTTCKTTQKWQKEGHITTPVPVDPIFRDGIKCYNFKISFLVHTTN